MKYQVGDGKMGKEIQWMSFKTKSQKQAGRVNIKMGI